MTDKLRGKTLQTFGSAILRWLNQKLPLIGVTGILLLLWEILGRQVGWDSRIFPPPSSILGILAKDRGQIGWNILYSLRLLAVGYTLGALAGVLSGALMGWSPRWRYWIMPLVRFLGPIPALALLPVVIYLFPNGFSGSVFLIALTTWFPVTLMTWSGVANLEPTYYEVARTLGANPSYLLWRVALPGALPSTFTGLFMGLATAFITLVTAERLWAKAGLGWYLFWGQGAPVRAYGAVFLMAVVFSALIALLFVCRNRFLAWQRGTIRW